MSKFEEVKSKIASIEEDARKFYEKGNSAAGTRLRKGFQEISVLCKEGRSEVLSLKNDK